jgi:hypothetical protein
MYGILCGEADTLHHSAGTQTDTQTLPAYHLFPQLEIQLIPRSFTFPTISPLFRLSDERFYCPSDTVNSGVIPQTSTL